MAVVVIVAWLEASLVSIATFKPSLSGLYLSADNALRLVEIRDLLGGQSWFDLTQYRIGPPLGIAMHWTRVVDGPIAALILLFRLVLPDHEAETLAISAWPLLLLLPALFAVVRIATRLADRETGVAALFLAAITCLTTFGEFRPGEIDHHNLQIVLTLWSAALLIDVRDMPRAPLLLGIISALSLAIGLETLPYQLAVILALAGLWIWRGPESAAPVRRFGGAFAMAVLFVTFTIIAPHERYGAACDTLSGLFSTLAVLGGTGLAGLTLAPGLTTPTRRGAAIAGLGGILLAVMLSINPQCLGGPYAAISPLLERIWLSHILEARSPFSYLAKHPAMFINGYFYACVMMAGGLAAVFLLEGRRRVAAAIACGFAGIALLIASFGVRGVPFATLLAIPGLAACIRLTAMRFARPGWPRAVVMIAGLIALSNFAFSIPADYFLGTANASNAAATKRCTLPQLEATLKPLPPGQVASDLDLAPAILALSSDTVMAGNYHRDTAGILQTYRFFTDPAAGAAVIARRHGLDYVLLCRANFNYGFYLRDGGPRSLIASLDKGRPPPWLVPTKIPPSGYRMYRVVQDKLPPPAH